MLRRHFYSLILSFIDAHILKLAASHSKAHIIASYSQIPHLTTKNILRPAHPSTFTTDSMSMRKVTKSRDTHEIFENYPCFKKGNAPLTPRSSLPALKNGVRNHNTPAESKEASQLRTPSSELGITSSELGTPSPELGIPSPELGIPSSEPGTPSPELRIPSPEPGTPSPELGIDATRISHREEMNAMQRERKKLAEEIRNMEFQADSWRRRIGAAWDYVRLVEGERLEDQMTIQWHVGDEKAKLEGWPIRWRDLKKKALAKEKERTNDAKKISNGKIGERKRNVDPRRRRNIGETFDSYNRRMASRGD